MILFLFLAHLGVGILATFVFVSREAGVKFFRFNAGLAAILVAVAFMFARQVADAVEAAHEHGVMHRDLIQPFREIRQSVVAEGVRHAELAARAGADQRFDGILGS